MADMLSKNFSRDELACKCGCGFCPTFDAIKTLQEFRDFVNKPIIVTSGARCRSWNAKQGGSSNSYHTKGLAFDFHIKGVSLVELYALLLKFRKFKHIGVYPRWNNPGCHADISNMTNHFYSPSAKIYIPITNWPDYNQAVELSKK